MPKGDRDILKADPEDGTTPIANLLLEALAMAHLSGEEKGAVLFLWRRTYGWAEGDRRKIEDEISLPEWAAALDTSKDYSARVVKQLVKKRIIIQKDLGKGKGYTYSMNTRVDQWDRGSLNGLLLSERYSQGLSKRYSPLPTKKTTPPDTNLAIPKETLNKDIKKRGNAKERSDPVIGEIFKEMKNYLRYPDEVDIDPIPNYGKEGKSIRRMLTRGFSAKQILDCWKVKVAERAEFVSMVWVNEDIGRKGGRDGARALTYGIEATRLSNLHSRLYSTIEEVALARAAIESMERETLPMRIEAARRGFLLRIQAMRENLMRGAEGG